MNNKRSDPPWVKPGGAEVKQSLHLYNSLTRRKDPFIPQKEIVTWYSCGPTVYDHSHMGHARSYMSFDILRRVMQDYFGYQIHYVMNVTDIDDKIIKRARTRYLVEQYKKSLPSSGKLMSDITASMELHEQRIAETTDPDKLKMLLDEVAKVTSAAADLKSESPSKFSEARINQLLDSSSGVLGEWLDKVKGHQVTDNSIFAELPRYYEDEFNNDMEALNVLPADVVTRVSEYVPEIVSFVQTIIKNGFAYEAKNSVYFDVGKFEAQSSHYYAKLVPEAYGDQAALEEGEGSLSSSTQGKKHPNDFALWKASKPGEPAWPSPWGEGRPGWHIECSAMASAILGDSMDIHTGGVDLKFPHHDNELAQSEAYYNSNQWVNYFLHTGHLHINGCKMSKSLKNFITIKEALKTNSAAQLRVAFLLHSWKDTLDYSLNTMEGSTQFLKMVTEFGLNVDDCVRRLGPSLTTWTDAEVTLNKGYDNARSMVHKALCDNIDTRSTLDALREVITETNKYMSSNQKVNSQSLMNIKNFVFHMMEVFGVTLGSRSDDGESSDKVLKLGEVIGDIREQLRKMARDGEKDAKEIRTLQLQLCDDIRDVMLPPLGVRLEDREEGAPSIKIMDPEQLIESIKAKQALEEAKRLEKEKKKIAKDAAKAVTKTEEVKDPKDMFRTSEYTAWDENGFPTKDKEGKEITKSQIKKLKKVLEAQNKKYEKWKAS